MAFLLATDSRENNGRLHLRIFCPLCSEVRANQKMLDKYHFEQRNRVNAGTAIVLILVQQLHQFI